MTLQILAQLLAAYSLGAVLVVGLTHFNRRQYPGQPGVWCAGWVLLVALAVLQAMHLSVWWGQQGSGVLTPWYGAALLLVAPCFYAVARQVLRPEAAGLRPLQWALHGAPVVLAWVLPLALVVPLAFGVGAFYLLWLLRMLWRLRAARSQWQHELALLALAAVLGVGVCALGVSQVAWMRHDFFAWYAVAIGLALLLVQVLLGWRPQLVQDVMETAQTAAYATTTLSSVDVPAALARLEQLMGDGQRYRDAELSLPQLAQELGLGAHQLSELINTRLGKGFARYLRELRVADAKQMLVQEPGASVLGIGLCAGFSSQSNFYEAFREIEGSTPGQYRKLQLAKKAAKPMETASV